MSTVKQLIEDLNSVDITDGSSLGFEARTVEDDERETIVYEVWTNASLVEMQRLVVKYFQRTDCGHSHDCCGCWFRFTTRVVSEFDKEGVAYLIIDSWLRNI